MSEAVLKRKRASADPWGRPAWRGPLPWLRDHWQVARDSLSHVSSRLGTSLVVWLLVGIALALPGGLYILQSNLAVMTAGWEGRPGLSLYFSNQAAPAQMQALQTQLAADARVANQIFISADAALEEFQRFAGVSDVLAHLDSNPLPASLRVIARDGVTPTELEALAQQLKAAPGVDDVSVERTWLERMQAMTDAVRRLGLLLALLFSVGAVLVTATSVRLAIEARLDELRVMKLVGATQAYMRRPFLYFGLFYGLGGALVGAMLISTLLLILEPPLARLLGSYGESVQISGLNLWFFLQLLGLGGLLGVSGALLAARQRLVDLEILAH